MAARTTPKPEYDFDNWTEELEEAAVAALIPQVQYIIVEKTFVGRFPDGVIVKVPLTISLDDVDTLAESGDPVDQFKALLTRIGGADVAKEFSRHDLTETVLMAEKFFSVFSRISKAALPESSASPS